MHLCFVFALLSFPSGGAASAEFTVAEALYGTVPNALFALHYDAVINELNCVTLLTASGWSFAEAFVRSQHRLSVLYITDTRHDQLMAVQHWQA